MVVDEVKEITEAMGGALDRALTVRVEPSEAVWALGDSDRTRHILLNLASNAVRYTPGGSITFALRQNGDVIGASVRDTGPGIAPEHVERIFDHRSPLELGDQPGDRETEAGAAIARLFAELQG